MRKATKLGRSATRREVGRDVGRVGVVIPEGLRPTASPRERISVLLALGLSVEELALSLGVAANTIRSWADGSAEPRRSADRVLDDLRTVVVALDEAGVQGARAVRWLRSRNRAWLDNERPLDILRSDPLLVLAAAEEPELVEQEPKQTVHSIAAAQARRYAGSAARSTGEGQQAEAVAT